MHDLISINIPAYNHAYYIRETINACINQTYPNIEIIIIDDGSTDNTWREIQKIRIECEKRFQRCIFLTQKNMGVNNTVNQMVDLSLGKYIYYTASDDIPKANAIEALYNFLSKDNKYSLVVGDNEYIDKYSHRISGATFGEKLHCKELQEQGRFGSYSDLLLQNHITNGYLIRRSIMQSLKKYKEPFTYEDYYRNLQISKIARMYYIDEVLFSYRIHDSNTIKSLSSPQQCKELDLRLLFLEHDYCFSNNFEEVWLARLGKTVLNYGTFEEFSKIYISFSRKEWRLLFEAIDEFMKQNFIKASRLAQDVTISPDSPLNILLGNFFSLIAEHYYTQRELSRAICFQQSSVQRLHTYRSKKRLLQMLSKDGKIKSFWNELQKSRLPLQDFIKYLIRFGLSACYRFCSEQLRKNSSIHKRS